MTDVRSVPIPTDDNTAILTAPPRDVVFRYCDADGSPLYGVVRKPDKQFIQRRMEPSGKWHYGIDGIERVPYRPLARPRRHFRLCRCQRPDVIDAAHGGVSPNDEPD